MNSRILLVIAVLCVTLAVSDGALKCYRCAASEEGCQDPFNTNSGVEKSTCLANQKVCKKQKTTVDGKSTVSRSCATDCREGSSGNTDTFCCGTELCNSASSLAAGIILIPAAFIAVYKSLL